MLAGEAGLIQAHQRLIGFGNVPLGFEVKCQIAEVVAGIDGDGDIQNAALEGEFGFSDDIGVIIPRVYFDERIAGKESQISVVAAGCSDQLSVREVDTSLLEASFEVGHE